MKTERITAEELSTLVIEWEQYKKANWYESDAIDVEAILMNQFATLKAYERMACNKRIPFPPAEGADAIAQRCPVCGGNGILPNGFYDYGGIGSTMQRVIPEPCRTCNGTGIIPSHSHAQRIADKIVEERMKAITDEELEKEYPTDLAVLCKIHNIPIRFNFEQGEILEDYQYHNRLRHEGARWFRSRMKGGNK